MKHCAIFLSLLIIALCGCSNSTQPPAAFSQQLSTADRLVATNRYFAFGSTVTGTEVSSLAKAVTSAKRQTLGAATDCDWDADFFAGTNHLAVIHLHDSVISVDGIQYRDDSGVVTKFWQKPLTERTR